MVTERKKFLIKEIVLWNNAMGMAQISSACLCSPLHKPGSYLQTCALSLLRGSKVVLMQVVWFDRRITTL
jgi:hypothetical protein